MYRILFIIIIFLTLPVKSNSQNVTVEATIDSLQILIGEQVKIGLEVTIDGHQYAQFPFFPDTLITGIEVLEISKPDTQYINNGERLLIKQEYTITSFDSALYYIPPLSVIVDNQEYQSKSLALKVYSVPVDLDNPDMFYGQKPQFKPEFLWEDWWPLFALSFISIPLLILLIYLIIRLRDNKPILRRIKVEPKIPPHILAMQEIERVKADKIWQKGELSKEYYTELTDIIRTYIQDRFGFNAMEMTSTEIINKLIEINETEDISELKELFHTSDLVKFAKHYPLINENDANLIYAIEFINDTKNNTDENDKAQPTEVTIIEKRPLRAKIILISGIVAISIAMIVSFIYIAVQLFNLLT